MLTGNHLPMLRCPANGLMPTWIDEDPPPTAGATRSAEKRRWFDGQLDVVNVDEPPVRV